jgi:hypothetical protein
MVSMDHRFALARVNKDVRSGARALQVVDVRCLPYQHV